MIHYIKYNYVILLTILHSLTQKHCEYQCLVFFPQIFINMHHASRAKSLRLKLQTDVKSSDLLQISAGKKNQEKTLTVYFLESSIIISVLLIHINNYI